MNKKPNILFIYANSEFKTGNGHVFRSLALGEAWQKKRNGKLLIIGKQNDYIKNILVQKGIDFCENCNLELIIKEYKDYNRNLIYDSYQPFDENFYKLFNKVIIIDDFSSQNYYSSYLIVNPNYGISRNIYKNKYDKLKTKLLIGNKYIIIRNEVLNSNKAKIRKDLKNVLITFGGTDPENITYFTLNKLKDCKMFNYFVFVNNTFKHLKKIYEIANVNPSISIINKPEKLIKYAINSDISIVSGGITMWEMMYLGIPLITFARNEIQSSILSKLASKNLVIYLGYYKNIEQLELCSLLNNITFNKRIELSTNSQSFIDGKGINRILKYL